MTYLDFSDPTNLGRDCTGNEAHGNVKGNPIYQADTIRVHSMHIDNIIYDATDEPQTNQNYIEFNSHLNKFAVSDFSVSMWFNANTSTEYNTLWGCGTDDIEASRNDIQILIRQGLCQLLAYDNGTPILRWSVDTTENVWHHSRPDPDS